MGFNRRKMDDERQRAFVRYLVTDKPGYGCLRLPGVSLIALVVNIFLSSLYPQPKG
jgi:hypothetical protein